MQYRFRCYFYPYSCTTFFFEEKKMGILKFPAHLNTTVIIMKYILGNIAFTIEMMLAIILFFLVFAKIILSRSIKSKSILFYKLIYFSNYSIINSRNGHSRQTKIMQNRISIVFLIILIPEVFLYY